MKISKILTELRFKKIYCKGYNKGYDEGYDRGYDDSRKDKPISKIKGEIK